MRKHNVRKLGAESASGQAHRPIMGASGSRATFALAQPKAQTLSDRASLLGTADTAATLLFAMKTVTVGM